jgi:hypothetical protein
VAGSCECGNEPSGSGATELANFILTQCGKIVKQHDKTTEHRGRVVNILASYSGGPGFKSRPGDRLPLLRFFVVFFSTTGQIPE